MKTSVKKVKLDKSKRILDPWLPPLVEVPVFCKKITLFPPDRNALTGPFFKNSENVEVRDKITLENRIMIGKYLRKILPKMANNGYINVPCHDIKYYGRYSVNVNAIYVWRFLKSQHQRTLFYLFRTKQLKDLIINFFLITYIWPQSLKRV